MSDTQKEAVIYARSATRATNDPGDSIAAQERACRDAAEADGYKVVAVFAEHAGGHSADRPGLRAMLAFLDTRGERKPAVFVENIHCLARNVDVVYKLQKEIAGHGGTLHTVEMCVVRRKKRISIELERD